MKKFFILLLAPALLLWGCNQDSTQKKDGYTNKDIKLESNLLTPEVLWQLGRVGNVNLSDDHQYVVYTVAYTDIKENVSYSDIYLLNTKTKDIKQLTNSKNNESSVKWKPSDNKITFVSGESGSRQIYEMDLQGNQKQLSDIEGGISDYLFSPDGTHLLYTKEVKVDKDIHDRYPDLPKANARIEDDIMYRHWDNWEDGLYSHIFVSNISEGALIKDGTVELLKDKSFDSPLMPFGGMEQISWTPDSKSIAYTCKKMTGKAYAVSTNSDIYLYNLDDNTTKNLTELNKGYDMNPAFSPDGKYMAWESMERDGYEADKNRLLVMELTTGKVTDYTKDLDQNAGSLAWDQNNNIYFISNYHGTDEIYKVSIPSAEISKITEGVHNFNSVLPAGDKLIATMTSMNHPTEIYAVNEADGKEEELSFANKAILDQLKMGKVESRWITTTDNKQMQTWVIYPPDFDPNKKYPTLLYCQGGPQATISQSWSLRWNFQLMAAKGYIIVAPNRRGLPGFGQEWNEQISGDYGGQNMKDYFSAIDAMSKEPFVDETKLGCVGASYGGFSVYWLAGHHEKRFKAFVAHCGIFNMEQMYPTTEEMWFVNWDMKGAYWEKDNAAAQKTYANSPHKFVGNWDTPILVIHGEKDFRIPYTQGMGAFNSAILRGVPARFLYFPEECHWVQSPQNGILWHREFFRWLDTYLKN